ncbi:MAG: outer membrane protein assembly factor BamE [Planctomycetota bacterium]|nr:MAG: outer membrane protein assembly factor BamE [Planctomycetota bacterium]
MTLAAGVLSGCIVEGSRHIHTEGRYIGDQTLSMIEPGQTTQTWVLAVMGEPTRRSVLDGGVEVWTWDYRRIRHADTEVFLIFDGDKRTETTQSVYVEFADGVVTRAWRDTPR